MVFIACSRPIAFDVPRLAPLVAGRKHVEIMFAIADRLPTAANRYTRLATFAFGGHMVGRIKRSSRVGVTSESFLKTRRGPPRKDAPARSMCVRIGR
jgi:hypothetical protein